LQRSICEPSELRAVQLESSEAEASVSIEGTHIEPFRGRTANAVVVDSPAVIVAIDAARARSM